MTYRCWSVLVRPALNTYLLLPFIPNTTERSTAAQRCPSPKGDAHEHVPLPAPLNRVEITATSLRRTAEQP